MIDLRNTAKSLISLTWASTLVAVILIVIIRIVFLLKNKDTKVYFYQEIFNLIFLIYILQLFQIVTSTDINLYVGGITGNDYFSKKEIIILKKYNINTEFLEKKNKNTRKVFTFIEKNRETKNK